MKDTGNMFAWFGNAITISAAIASQDVLQVILLVVGVISACFSLFVNIYTWWLKAKADGKIDDQELDELGQIVNEGKEGLTQLQKDLGESEKEVSEKSEGDK